MNRLSAEYWVVQPQKLTQDLERSRGLKRLKRLTSVSAGCERPIR